MLTRPWRIDLTSYPCRTSPHSKFSRMWYSCRARRFVAIVFSVLVFSISGPLVDPFSGDDGQPHVPVLHPVHHPGKCPFRACAVRVVDPDEIGLRAGEKRPGRKPEKPCAVPGGRSGEGPA